jgi:hypothetical protein
MGAWGTGLYQNDTAADVKMVFNDLSSRPIGVETLVAEVLAKFGCGKTPVSEDDFDIWLVLTDLLHQYALDHPPTMDAARRLIVEGKDLAMKRDLGMSERDLEKRRKILAETLGRWSAPHPRPKKHKAPKTPEAFQFGAGEVWAFPAMRNAALPFHAKDADLTQFNPDGWGGFAVADRWHVNGHRACYLFVLAVPAGPGQPTLEAIRDAPVLDCTFTIEAYGEEWTYPMIFEARLAKGKQGPKRWHAERLGTLPLDAAKVRRHHSDRLKNRYNAMDADGIAWLEDELTVTSYHRDASNARTGLEWRLAPHPSLRLRDLCGETG